LKEKQGKKEVERGKMETMRGLQWVGNGFNKYSTMMEGWFEVFGCSMSWTPEMKNRR
jgi:hypothetical protein